MQNALIIGSLGTIGSALVRHLQPTYQVTELNRSNCDYSEARLEQRARSYAQHGGFDLIICCIGALHDDQMAPEKRLSEINAERLSRSFEVNTILPALCLRFFSPLLRKGSQPSAYLALSAMVGSIGENQLGGWYGYRSSKAALNMLLKTASVELKRSHKNAVVVAVHPGTTQGPLSRPYSRGVAEQNYYTPEQSAARIATLAATLKPENTGQFLNWDGRQIEW